MSQVPREGPKEELAHKARDSQPQVTEIRARASTRITPCVRRDMPSRPCATNSQTVSTYRMPVTVPVPEYPSRGERSRCRARWREALTTSRQVLSPRWMRREHNELLSSDYVRAEDMDTERADEEKREVAQRERDREGERQGRRTATSPGSNPSLQHRRTHNDAETSRTAEERRGETKEHRGNARGGR